MSTWAGPSRELLSGSASACRTSRAGSPSRGWRCSRSPWNPTPSAERADMADAPKLIALNKLGELRNQDPKNYQIVQELQQKTNGYILDQHQANGDLGGLVRGGAPFTAAEISGDGTTSGSNVLTVTRAATLTTPRAINGVNFEGSAPITVAAAAGTLTGTTLVAGVTGSSLKSIGTLDSGASPTASQLKLAANATGALSGLSFAPDLQAFGFDADWSGSAWIARHTSAYVLYKTGSQLRIYGNTGLTPGNSFVPSFLGAIPGVLFTQTNSVKVTNTVAETSLVSTGVGTAT